MAQIMPQVDQGVGQVPRTLTGPQQRGHRVAAGGRIDEPLEVLEQSPIGGRDRVTATSGSANPWVIRLVRTGSLIPGLEFGDAAADHGA